jgi:hypothetical protein
MDAVKMLASLPRCKGQDCKVTVYDIPGCYDCLLGMYVWEAGTHRKISAREIKELGLGMEFVESMLSVSVPLSYMIEVGAV